MAACLKHPHLYCLVMLLTALHLIDSVSCSCISASEQNLNVNPESGKLYVRLLIFVIFLASAQNFEVKFYNFITCL